MTGAGCVSRVVVRVYAFGMSGMSARALTELDVVGKCDGGIYKGTTTGVPIGKQYNVTWAVANVVLMGKGDHVVKGAGSNLTERASSILLFINNP